MNQVSTRSEAGTAPWLSILIPVYNVETYLSACVASVLAQDLSGVEVLLLDDASTDGSARLMQELAAHAAHPLGLLRHERNRGLSAARNSLLEASRGEYLWFLDSDDLLMPGAVSALAHQIRELQRPDLVLVDFRVMRERERLKHRLRGESHRRTFAGPSGHRLQDRGALIEGVFRRGLLHSWSKIARREVWGESLRFPEGRYFEDMYTTPPLLLRCHSYSHLARVCVAYRQREGSILANMNTQKIQDMMGALVDLPQRLRAAGVQHAAAEEALAQYAARTFVTACRFAQRSATLDEAQRAQWLRAYLADFERSSPITPEQLLRACWRRGWFWRGLRLAHWIKQARAPFKG